MPFDREAARRQLTEGPGILEWVAREHGVATIEILRLLPEEDCVIVGDPPVADLLAELTGWGEVLILVHTPTIVAEVVSPLPEATEGHGYFNFHGDTPFGGHLKQGVCSHVACIERSMGGRRSLCVAFYDGNGESIFEIFARRDGSGELRADHVARFTALRERMRAQSERRTA